MSKINDDDDDDENQLDDFEASQAITSLSRCSVIKGKVVARSDHWERMSVCITPTPTKL